MKPKFDNKGLNILYYSLFYASGIATAVALIGYKRGYISLAAAVAIGAVLVFFTLFHMGWTYFWNKENSPAIEKNATAVDDTSESSIDSYEAKADCTPKRLFLALLTILILLISWGWAWSQHVFDGVFFMDAPFSTYIGVTLLSLGMLLVAFFPFLQDEDRFKNKVHLDLSISRKLTSALFVALGLLGHTFLNDNPDGTPWETITILVLLFVWINILCYYHDRISNVRDAKNAMSETGNNRDTPDLTVQRSIVWTIVEIVTLILLVVAWYIKLSEEGLSFVSVFQSPLTTLVFTLISIAWLVVAYHPGWFLSRVKEHLTVKQISSFVNINRSLATVFAMFTLLSSLHDYMHYEESNQWIVIGTVLLFGIIGWFFGGLDKRQQKKDE